MTEKASTQRKIMCFTATGSFVAAGILTIIGILTLRKTKLKSHLPLASIPLGFAIQQIAEGILWLTIANKQYAIITNFATYLFLIFAFIIWPLLIPIALWIPEKNVLRKKLLLIISVCGFLLSAFLTYVIFNYNVSAQIVSHSITYDIAFLNSFQIEYRLFFYIIPVIIPFFVSSISLGNIMGTLIALSLIATYYFMKINLTSVWCFFAALISILVFFIIQREERCK